MPAALFIGDVKAALSRVPPDAVIRQLESPASFRELNEEFVGLECAPLLVLYDLADLGGYSSVLLKFVDDYQGSLMCFSSADVISPALVSRFVRVRKTPDLVDHTTVDSSSILDGLGEDRDLSRLIAEFCPTLLLTYTRTRGLPARDTLISLLL